MRMHLKQWVSLGAVGLATFLHPFGSLAQEPTEAPPECEGVFIESVELEGVTRISTRQRAALTDPYANRCLGVEDIENLMGLVTQHYLERGFSTSRVYLPDQDLTSGTLRLLVLEGRIAALEVENDPSGRVNAHSAMPAEPGDILNSRDLEQALAQINSAPGNAVKLDVAPGEIAGESTVIFRNEPGAWWKGSVSVDNYADQEAWQGGASLSVGSLMGVNDTGTLTFNQFEKDTKSQSHSLSWSLPIGYTTYGLSYSQSAYESPLNLASGNTLTSSGKTTSMSLSANRVMFRSATTTHTLTSEYAYSDARNYLDEELLIVSSKISRSLSLGVKSEDNDFYAGTLTTTPKLAIGLLDPQNIPGVNVDSEGPPPQYTKYTLNVNYKRPFEFLSLPLTWSSTYQTQYTDEPAGGLSIGGLGSVRGFETTSVSGDLGYYWQNELTWNTSFEVGGVSVAEKLLIAYDMGHVYGVVPGAAEGTLRGIALGATTSFLGSDWDLIWTTPSYRSEGLPSDDPRLWARISYNF